eukprot:364815-Chlamydomonas_euryale.AAC.1
MWSGLAGQVASSCIPTHAQHMHTTRPDCLSQGRHAVTKSSTWRLQAPLLPRTSRGGTSVGGQRGWHACLLKLSMWESLAAGLDVVGTVLSISPRRRHHKRRQHTNVR